MCEHAIILVSKIPTPGMSKTRLIPLLGAESAAMLAKNMLLDLIAQLSATDFPESTQLYLYYPGVNDANESAASTLANLNVANQWICMNTPICEDARKVNLSTVLSYALQETADRHKGSITFIGSDTPYLPVAEMITGMQRVTRNSEECYICPANDGGYVLLTVTSSASSTIFENIRWSTEHTCADQMKALCLTGLSTRVGNTYSDIDLPEDVKRLQRFHKHFLRNTQCGKRTDGQQIENSEKGESRPNEEELPKHESLALMSNSPLTMAFISLLPYE